MPAGDYDKTLESSEALAIYEGSRFMRFLKDTIAGFKYGTKSNPKVKGNVISYIDPMGRLITQEKTLSDEKDNMKIERIVRKISTTAKTEAFTSIEVIEQKRDANNELKEQVRNFYPTEEAYAENEHEPKIKEITYYGEDNCLLRKTIERSLDEAEMRKRFEIGAIKLNPLVPDTVKKEIVKSKVIYTVDKQKTENEIEDKLKAFGTHLQINETEKTYITVDDLNPEFDEIKDYVGPTEEEKDIILYSSLEPKARIEEQGNITFSSGKIHKISTSISNYPDKDGNYGGEGRGTYAMYDDKILHATGNKSLNLTRDENGNLHSKVSASKDENVLAKAELRGSLISLNIHMKKKEEAEDLVAEVSEKFSTKWGITKGSIIEYTLVGSDEKYKIKCKDIIKKENKNSNENSANDKAKNKKQNNK